MGIERFRKLGNRFFYDKSSRCSRITLVHKNTLSSCDDIPPKPFNTFLDFF